MEDVAKAGGFEEHAKLKAQQELMDTMNKMPPEKFFQLKDMLGSLERMLDTGGSDLGILSGLKDSITDTIKTEFDAVTAEFQNSLNTLINTALEPIMPYIQVALQGITSAIGLSFSGLTAMLTGKWDDFEKRLESMFPGITEWRDEFRVSQTNLFWGEDWELQSLMRI